MKKKQVCYPKLEPQPQVFVAFGLINLKPIPIKLVMSISVDASDIGI